MKKAKHAKKLVSLALTSALVTAPVLALQPKQGYAAETAAAEAVSGTTAAGSAGQVFDMVYEAENAALSGAIIDNKHAGFTGTGFVDYNPNTSGGWLEWTVEVPEAGEYTLEFRYASGAAEDRPAEIKVGDTVAVPKLSFQPTGDFATWLTTSVKVNLREGTNVIRATATGNSGGANIDHLRVHNRPESDTPAPVELVEVEVQDLLGGLLVRKLESLGMLAGEQSAGEPVTGIAFMSLLNDTLGFTHEDTYKNVKLESEIWGKSLADWDAYIIEAAREAGYAVDGKEGPAAVEEPLTRRDAAVMLAKALKLKAGKDSRGAIGAVTKEGYMSAEGGRGFGQKDYLTVGEAEFIRELLEKKVKGALGADDIRIAGVHAVASNIAAVTLNGKLKEVDVKDIVLSVPTGSWKSLTPAFKDLQLTKAAAGENRYGNTVLFFETVETFGDGGLIEGEEAADDFAGDLGDAVRKANNLVSWQMDHGGWTKAMPYDRAWDGKEPKSSQTSPTGVELGTIDNDATINELRFISEVYRETGNEAFKESVRRGVDFLLTMQVETGGWPQVYPQRGNPGDGVYYSNYVTFNDNAMINVLDLIDDMLARNYPYDTDLVDAERLEQLKQARDKGIEYILKSQIKVDGVLAAWCAQHDPLTYEPRGARAYEHPSVSGSESVGIIRYLMSRPEQTEEIKRAVAGALKWFEDVKLEGIRYVKADPNGEYFVKDPGAVSWYRFYEIGTNKGIFSGRDGIIKYSIQEIEKERRDGYSWGGSYAARLLETAKTTGYYEDRVYARVAAARSTDASGRTLAAGDIRQAGDVRDQLRAMPSRLVVAQDGKGDYRTVQGAIDAVQANNTDPVEIFVHNGVYKEVVTIPANKPFITLTGESAEGTVLTYDNYSGREKPTGGTYGTSGSASVFISGSDVTVRNLTIENSFDEASVDVKNKQAVALNVRGDRHRFENVRFLGNQDTLLTNGGTQYFYKCYIEGDVDFIFGGSRAVFDECTIHSLDRGSSSNNGYITAASTMITEPYGYLIVNSKLTSDAAPGTVWLGRPWHPGGNPDAIASVVFMNTEMGAHINPIGWTDMSGFSAADARFFEYNNHGPGAVVTGTRRQLTGEQAAEWTIPNVLKGWDPKAK
ncbi:pectate lyase [Paenibacillus tarimensis]|uniref:pectate lyase n=1 Tax=Paenibacillus tarimensis TaxID=416012 RepID=UPI0039EF35A8